MMVGMSRVRTSIYDAKAEFDIINLLSREKVAFKNEIKYILTEGVGGSSELVDMGIFENPLVRKSQLERREYQVNIAETATKQDVLAVLPTALGKTEIAALAAAHFLLNHWDMKVLVMAPTRPLVAQHYERFLRLLRVKAEHARILTGETDPAQRMHEWGGGARLFFSTPQTVWNDHEQGLDLSGFSFIVADECHRSRLRYAYTRIAVAYTKECQHPIIMGLTASPGATSERIAGICSALKIERIEARTEEDPDVRPYVHPIELEWKKVELPQGYRELCNALRDLELRKIEKLKKRGRVPKPARAVGRRDLVDLQRRLVAEAKSDRTLWHAVMLAAEAVQVSYLRELLGSQGKEAALAFIGRMRASGKRTHKAVLRELDSIGFEAKVRALGEHPKIPVLKEIISAQNLQSPESRILVFNQYRDSIQHIVSVMKGDGIRAERFVGQADKNGSEGMSQGEQLQILEKLKRGELQALVLSSVGEEGLDIPSADLVVFYEPVPSEIRYIQRKGRTGRVRIGRAVALVADGTTDSAYMWVSLRKARRMREIIEKLEPELQPIPRGPDPPLCSMPAEAMAPERHEPEDI
jgi:Fanconi anemia group M protein